MGKKDFQTLLRRRAIKQLDVRHILASLKVSTELDESTVVRIYLTLQDVLMGISDEGLVEFLSLFPQSSGGVIPIATGLFHPRWEVRRASTRLLWRLDWHKVLFYFTRKSFSCLPFP